MKTVSQIFSKQELTEMIVNAQNIRFDSELDQMLREEMLIKNTTDFVDSFNKAVGLKLKYLGANQYTILYNNNFFNN